MAGSGRPSCSRTRSPIVSGTTPRTAGPSSSWCSSTTRTRSWRRRNTSPLVWDGTDDGLPDGWDGQLLGAVADHEAGRTPNTLGALQIVVDPARQGSGLSGQMLLGMRALGAGAPDARV